MHLKIPLALLLAVTGAFGQTHPALKLIESRCAGCHSGSGRQSGLDLSRRDLALRGGDRGPAIVPGKARESFLYRVLAHEAKPAMPKAGARFSETELATIAAWIDEGAPWAASTPATAAQPPAPSHWAFRKPVRATPPVPANGAWVRNPIDAFLAAGHEQRKLTPVAAVSKL